MVKKIFLAFICVAVIALAGCSANSSVSSAPEKNEQETAVVSDFFKIGSNSDLTYNFKVYTRSGGLLISEKNYSMKPSAELINQSVLKLWAGEGESTKWVRYCDLDAAKVSEVYYGVLDEYNENVIYTEFCDGQHYIAVKNIFEPDVFVREYLLENAAVDADPKLELTEKDGVCSLTVTYLSGLNKEPKTMVFEVK